ncbi:MAG: hypothetical protein RLZZ502_1651 [Pseudomonadota bacterium]|jgi:2-(1,2-epoxy-1,2-dihydrophenyl)acetyl-CoA isomerase
MYETIHYTCVQHIARLTFNRPEKMNSFTEQMHSEVRQAIAQALADQARVLLITAHGRGFCAGQDLSDRAVSNEQHVENAGPKDLSQTIGKNWNPLIASLRALNIPVVAAVNGVAAGAGASVALAADIVIAAESASFLQAFVNIGLMPDSGSSHFLQKHLGSARAMALCLLGEKLSAQEAAAWGLIWKCVPDAELMDQADKIASKLAHSAPLATAAIKKAIQLAETSTLSEQLEHERITQGQLGFSQDYQEGVSAFMHKRKANFRGNK